MTDFISLSLSKSEMTVCCQEASWLMMIPKLCAQLLNAKSNSVSSHSNFQFPFCRMIIVWKSYSKHWRQKWVSERGLVCCSPALDVCLYVIRCRMIIASCLSVSLSVFLSIVASAAASFRLTADARFRYQHPSSLERCVDVGNQTAFACFAAAAEATDIRHLRWFSVN